MGRPKKVPVELTEEQKEANKQLHKNCQLVIGFFLKSPAECNWPNEIKTAKELFKINNTLNFWFGITNLENKLNSLVFFKTPDGKKYIDLQNKKLDFTFKETPKFEILPEKVGESKIILKKEPIVKLINYIKK